MTPPEPPSGLELSVPRLEPDEAFLARLAARAGSATRRRARRGQAAQLLTAMVAAVALTFSGTALLVPVGDEGPVDQVAPLTPASSNSSAPATHPHRQQPAVPDAGQGAADRSAPGRAAPGEHRRIHPRSKPLAHRHDADRPRPPRGKPAPGPDGPRAEPRSPDHHDHGVNGAASGKNHPGDAPGDAAAKKGSDAQDPPGEEGDGATGGEPADDAQGPSADNRGKGPAGRLPADARVPVAVRSPAPGRSMGGKDVGED